MNQGEVGMMNKIRACVLLIVLSLIAVSLPAGAAPAGGAAESSLSEDALKAVTRSVLEVVVPKPEHDSLQYEKPLPLDLLPYAVRTDKYYSTGTAFAIGPATFVSAAH